ncbi:uncharacterized protein LA080_011693 [Diaporthe eres]|nr:uncharacterized protein LA080_011693 [Diaporthe eres]
MCLAPPGCVFQDTLARLRSAQGTRASVSLDIGYMRSAGYVARRGAESQAVRANARRLAPIETDELLGILGCYCDPALPPLDETRSQLLVGARTARDYAARGDEPIPATLRPPFLRGLTACGSRTPAPGAPMHPRMWTLRCCSGQADGVVERQVITLADYGTDSLMAVELRSWMRKDLGADVTVFYMTSGKSINAVRELVVAKVGAANAM